MRARRAKPIRPAGTHDAPKAQNLNPASAPHNAAPETGALRGLRLGRLFGNPVLKGIFTISPEKLGQHTVRTVFLEKIPTGDRLVGFYLKKSWMGDRAIELFLKKIPSGRCTDGFGGKKVGQHTIPSDFFLYKNRRESVLSGLK